MLGYLYRCGPFLWEAVNPNNRTKNNCIVTFDKDSAQTQLGHCDIIHSLPDGHHRGGSIWDILQKSGENLGKIVASAYVQTTDSIFKFTDPFVNSTDYLQTTDPFVNSTDYVQTTESIVSSTELDLGFICQAKLNKTIDQYQASQINIATESRMLRSIIRDQHILMDSADMLRDKYLLFTEKQKDCLADQLSPSSYEKNFNFCQEKINDILSNYERMVNFGDTLMNNTKYLHQQNDDLIAKNQYLKDHTNNLLVEHDALLISMVVMGLVLLILFIDCIRTKRGICQEKSNGCFSRSTDSSNRYNSLGDPLELTEPRGNVSDNTNEDHNEDVENLVASNNINDDCSAHSMVQVQSCQKLTISSSRGTELSV